VSGPGTGTTGPGIPGLPGIYLDGVQPGQAAQLAEAANHLSGPEQTLAQDVALQAAEKNPALTGPSDDPKVQSFQQTAQEYDEAAGTAKSAQEQWTDAQSRSDADKSVIDMARSKLDNEKATPAQQQAFNQMLQAAKTDEDAAEAARRIFDGAGATLAVSRTNAATALAALAPASGASSNLQTAGASGARPMPVPTTGSGIVDLSHARSSTPSSLKLATENGTPIPTPPTRTAALAPKLAPAPVQDLAACLSSAAGHPFAAGSSLPTPEELREQLQNAQEAIRSLVESRETEEDLREDATEQIKDAVHDAKKQAFDLTVDFVMHKAIAGVRSGIWQSSREVEDLRKLAASEADPAKLTALRSQIEQAATRQENLEVAREVLEKGKEHLTGRARLRDFREWTSKREELEQTKGQMEGVKQLIQAALDENRVKAALQYTPYVDSIVKWGSSLIDTSYDLAEEYVSAKEIDQYNRNSAQYLKGLDAINRRVRVSVGQLNCYKSGPAVLAQPTQITDSRGR
jgi:DNA repair exonuclease SbcCD ATPase subunit